MTATPEQAVEDVARFDAIRPPHQGIGPRSDEVVASREAAMRTSMEEGAGGASSSRLECTPDAGPEDGWMHCRSLFKSPRQIRWQLRLEWALLRREWRWVFIVLLIEYIHLVSRNLVYYIQGKVYRTDESATTKEFPMAPLEDLGFMALGEGQWLPVSLEWLETFFIAVLGGWMVLLWLMRLFLNVRMGGPKVAIAGRDFHDRPVLFIPMPVILIFRQMAMMAAVIVPLRCITFLTTLLPPGAEHCQHAWTPPQELSKVFNPFESPRTGCGDQMFSGHVSHGAIVAAMTLRYFPYHRLVPLFALTNLAALALFMVAFRAHYTADVLTALYVSAGSWLLLRPYEPRDLTQFGILANVLIRPNYMAVGHDLWRAREVMAQFDEGQAAEESAARSMEEGKAAGAGEGKEEEEVVHGEEGCVGRVCGRCGARVDASRRPPRRKMTYLPPLPPSCPPLEEHADLTESARAMERLPW